MNHPALRNILMSVAFVLLIVGAFLKLKGHPVAWYFVGVSIVLYIAARFFIKAPRLEEQAEEEEEKEEN